MTFTFDFHSAEEFDVECPPRDVYDLVITKVHPMENRPGYKASDDAEETTDTQNRIEFAIENYDYDPATDERDWNGTIVSDFYTWGRLYHNSGRTSQVWKADGTRGQQSKSNALLVAVLGEAWHPGMSFDPMEWEGKRIRATIEKNKRGYPKVVNPMPPSRKAGRTSTVQPQAAAAPAPVSGGTAEAPATTLQLFKIARLWQEAGLGDDAEMVRYAQNTVGVAPEDFTAAQAAAFIQNLESLDIGF